MASKDGGGEKGAIPPEVALKECAKQIGNLGRLWQISPGIAMRGLGAAIAQILEKQEGGEQQGQGAAKTSGQPDIFAMFEYVYGATPPKGFDSAFAYCVRQDKDVISGVLCVTEYMYANFLQLNSLLSRGYTRTVDNTLLNVLEMARKNIIDNGRDLKSFLEDNVTKASWSAILRQQCQDIEDKEIAAQTAQTKGGITPPTEAGGAQKRRDARGKKMARGEHRRTGSAKGKAVDTKAVNVFVLADRHYQDRQIFFGLTEQKFKDYLPNGDPEGCLNALLAFFAANPGYDAKLPKRDFPALRVDLDVRLQWRIGVAVHNVSTIAEELVRFEGAKVRNAGIGGKDLWLSVLCNWETTSVEMRQNLEIAAAHAGSERSESLKLWAASLALHLQELRSHSEKNR